jgi:ParB family chromosome partitioning protein
MNEEVIELVPVSKVLIVNPRERNRIAWLAIVTSIKAVGLKKPIRVSRRSAPDVDGKLFDLVCGQGRLEAFKELDEEFIPAIITVASKADQYLMSLVENIARRAPSNQALYLEIRNLLARGYDSQTIATKLGLHRTYVASIVRLVESGESRAVP